MQLQCKALKCTMVLDPAALVGLAVPEGQSRVTLHITPGGFNRVVTADIAAKSVRRAVAAVAEPA